MKRISLILACLMILSFGLAQGQHEIRLTSITGDIIANADTIPTGPLTFVFTYDFGSPNNKGVSNGFKFWSPDGATWVSTVIDVPNMTATLSEFDGGSFAGYFSADGALEDTATIGGFALFSAGIPAAAVRTVAKITVQPTAASDGKHLCVDSAWFPPGGDWVWADVGGSIVVDWGNGTFAPQYTDGDGYCFSLFLVPDLPPTVVNCPLSASFNHCNLATLDFVWADNESTTPSSFVKVSGPGSVTFSANQGHWSYSPTIADVGTTPTLEVAFVDGITLVQGPSCLINLDFTNVAPAFTAGCGGANVQVGKGNPTTFDFNASSGDCDPISFFISSVTPAPAGSYSINATTGLVTFNTVDPTDGGNTYAFNVCVTDGKDTVCCTRSVDVLNTVPFAIRIEKTHGTFQGMHELVDVTYEGGTELIGGFDFLISYDATALSLSSAIPGADFYAQSPAGCGWEYFTYRFSPFGNCGNACASGKVRVVGIAETNNGPNHPDCWLFFPGDVMFSLDFLVSDNRTYECQYAPVRFVWFDCGDNTISSKTGDSLFISRKVWDFDLIGELTDFTAGGYPTFQGAQDADCFAGNPQKVPFRFIDFFNGGVDIACAESIDARGDINLNEIPYEIADAVMYSRYFVYGLTVFTTNLQGQIAASDVNADGFTLSVADLVYLIRVVVGDAVAYPKLAPVAANVTTGNGYVTVDGEMGGALIVVEGNHTPTLLATHMEMQSNFDGSTTRILVWSQTGESFTGEFVKVDGNVSYTEFASSEGAPVVVSTKLVPTSFSLNQNYPNPFNASTNIAFGMPKAGDYTITVYNVTGQVVREIAGAGNAGENFVTVDMSGEASGVYFYKLNASNFSNTKKMIYLK